MHFVVYQVIQFQHVHITDGYRALKLITRTSVIERHLPAFRQIGQGQQGLDLFLLRAIKHWRCHRHTFTQIAGQLTYFLI